MNIRLRDIPNGEAGTDETVRMMISELEKSLRRGLIRLATIDILKSSRSGSSEDERVQSIFSFVIDNIETVPDPIRIETVQSPEITLEIGAGDCDDQALLIASMLESVGIPSRFTVIGNRAGEYSHVYTEALISGEWLPVDTLAPRGTPDLSGYPYEKNYSIHKAEDSMRGIGEYYTFQTTPTNREAETIERTTALLRELYNAGDLDPLMLDPIIKTVYAGEGPYGFDRNLRMSVITGVNRFKDELRSAGVNVSAVESVGVGFLNWLWAGAKYIAVDLVWNNVKKIWEKTDISIPDIEISGPSVDVQPKVGAGDIAGGLQAGLNNPIVIAILAGGFVWLITRK